MRGVAIGSLLAAAGCLYTGGLNHAPKLTLDPPSIAATTKGQAITVRAQMLDDSDSVLQLAGKLVFTVSAADMQTVGACDVYQTRTFDTGSFTFYRTGTFTIAATTYDHQNAQSNTDRVVVTITDAPPQLTPATVAPAPTSARNACDFYTAGDVITVGFTGGVSDGDQLASAPGCSTQEKLTYTWKVTAMPAGAQPRLTVLGVDNNCVAPDASSGTTLTAQSPALQICLWTDGGMAFASEMYSVQLEVTDGTTPVDSGIADIPVAPDQPPCITGTQPIATTSPYVVDRMQLQSFKVDGVFDDRDPFGSAQLTFAWSVRRSSDVDGSGTPIWRNVPMHSQSTYDLDTSQFLVGEVVNVRVVAIDRTGARPTCPTTPDNCVTTACPATPGGVCNQGKTWTLELR